MRIALYYSRLLSQESLSISMQYGTNLEGDQSVFCCLPNTNNWSPLVHPPMSPWDVLMSCYQVKEPQAYDWDFYKRSDYIQSKITCQIMSYLVSLLGKKWEIALNAISLQSLHNSRCIHFKDTYVGDMPFQAHLQGGVRFPALGRQFVSLVKGGGR